MAEVISSKELFGEKPNTVSTDELFGNDQKSALAKSAIIVHNIDSNKYVENRKNAVDQGMPASFASPSEGNIDVEYMNSLITQFTQTDGTKAGAFLSDSHDDFHNAKVFKDNVPSLTGFEKSVLNFQNAPFMARHPNIYAAYKTAENMIPYLKYIDPEEREIFSKLSTNEQTGELLGELLNTELFLGTPAIAKGVTGFAANAFKETMGKTFAEAFPKTVANLTKKINLPKNIFTPPKGLENLVEPDSNVSPNASISSDIPISDRKSPEFTKSVLEPKEKSLQIEQKKDFSLADEPDSYIYKQAAIFNKKFNGIINFAKEINKINIDPETKSQFIDSVTKDTPPIKVKPETVENILKKADKTPESLSDPTQFYEDKFMGNKTEMSIPEVVDNADHINPKDVNDMSVRDIPSVNELEEQKGGEALSTRGADVLDAAVERGIIPETGELPTHNKFNIEAEDVKANDYIKQNPEEALSQVLDNANIDKPYIESIYKNLETKAIQEGDVDSLLKLSKSDVPSEAGLRLKLLDSNNPDNPVKIMRDIRKSREESYIKKEGKTLDYAKHEEEVSRLKADLEAKDKALKSALAKVKERISTSAKLKYGTRNKIVTQDEYLKVKADLRQKFSSQMNVGLDPTIAADLGKIGTYHLEAGAREFGEWSAKIIEDVGEWAKPHLKEIWDKMKADAKLNTYFKTKKTRLTNEANKYTDKLNNLDFSKDGRMTPQENAETRALTIARDKAKSAWQAAQKIGSPTKEEAQKILDFTKEISELKEKAKSDPLGISVDLVNKQREFSLYRDSFAPKTPWQSIRDDASMIYKNLFIGVKTGVKTFTLGNLNSIIEAPVRRIAEGRAIGDVDASVKLKAITEVAKMYYKTGVNTIISTSTNDVFGASKMGISEHFGGAAQIEGKGVMPTVAKAVNLAARGVRYIAIDLLHKVPMVATSTINFADALDITSSSLAKMDIANGISANEIFTDALKVVPETDLGKIARLRSQQDTFRVLNINNSPLAEVTVKLQRNINRQIPTLGNYLIPMAKVPSNVVYNQLENFGIGIGTGLSDVIRGTSELNRLKVSGAENTIKGVDAVLKIRDGAKTLTRTVGVMGAAAIITMNITEDDFKKDNYGNSYVRIGDYWLNTDAFGGAGVAVAGMMMAKTGSTGTIFDYGKAGFDSLGRAPLIDSIQSIIKEGKKGELTTGLINSYINPIMAHDVEKSIQQKTAMPFFFGSLIRTQEQVEQSIPGGFGKDIADSKRKGIPLTESQEVAYEEMTKSEQSKIEKESQMTSKQVAFSHIPLEKAIKAWSNLKDEDREELREIYDQKKDNFFKEHPNMSEEKRQEFQDKIDKAEEGNEGIIKKVKKKFYGG